MFYFIFYPYFVGGVLFYFRKRLEDEKVKDRIGEMYNDIHLRRNSLTIYNYPAFIGKRIAFILLPIVLYDYEYF